MIYYLRKGKTHYFSLIFYFYSIHGNKKSEITFPSDSTPPLGVRSYLNNPLLSCERKKFIFFLPNHYIKSRLRSLIWPLPAMAALPMGRVDLLYHTEKESSLFPLFTSLWYKVFNMFIRQLPIQSSLRSIKWPLPAMAALLLSLPQ